MNLQGEATILSPDAPSYREVRKRYLLRFPHAEMMFDFGDCALWELQLENAHFVLGFGQAVVSSAATPAIWIPLMNCPLIASHRDSIRAHIHVAQVKHHV
jgi:putative heme iron utilization protein